MAEFVTMEQGVCIWCISCVAVSVKGWYSKLTYFCHSMGKLAP